MKTIYSRFLILVLLFFGQSIQSQTFDRGIKQSVLVPKGQWLTGGNFSYSERNMDNYKFLVLDGLTADGYTINVSPFLGYFYKDNAAVGVRFGYKRDKMNLKNLKMDLGDDIKFELKDNYTIDHVYYGTAMLRNYTSIGSSRRFGLFNEVQLTFGGGQGKMLTGQGIDLKGTYQDIYEFKAGMAPGLVAFITDQVAVEVAVGVLGFEWKKVKQKTNQVYKGSFHKSAANFKIDLFSINLGVAFYLPTLKVNPINLMRANSLKDNY